MRPGVFLFDFNSEEEIMTVGSKKWTFYNRYPILLKPWNVDQGFEEDVFSQVPEWIQLPGLAPRLWFGSNLGNITSYVGRPLVTNHMTSRRLRMDYARVLVEVNQNATHPEEIPITCPGGVRLKQKVVYEWKLQEYGACGFISHDAVQCKRRRQQIAPPQTQQPATRNQNGLQDTQNVVQGAPNVVATQFATLGTQNSTRNVREGTVLTSTTYVQGNITSSSSSQPLVVNPSQAQKKGVQPNATNVQALVQQGNRRQKAPKGGKQINDAAIHSGTTQIGSVSRCNSPNLRPNG